jgi:antitoxin CcdA
MRMENAMTAVYNPNAPKKAANLSINSELLQQAKELGINLSQSLEETLADKVARCKEELWLQENREAIQDYNHTIERRGLFSHGLRRF